MFTESPPRLSLHPQSNSTASSFVPQGRKTHQHTHTPTHTHTHSQMHTVVFPPLHHVTVFLNSENYKSQYISHLSCNLNWLNYHPPRYSSSVLMIFKYKVTLHLTKSHQSQRDFIEYKIWSLWGIPTTKATDRVSLIFKRQSVHYLI